MNRYMAGLFEVLAVLALLICSVGMAGWPNTRTDALVAMGLALLIVHAAALVLRGQLGYQMPIVFLLVPILAGMALSGQMVAEHLTGGHSGGPLSGICSQAGADCNSLLYNKWGRFLVSDSLDDAGIKQFNLAQLGYAYLTILAAWFVLVGRPKYENARWHLVPVLISGLACLGSVALLMVLWFQLKTNCKLCLMWHGLNMIVFVGTLLAWPRQRRRGLDEEQQYAEALAQTEMAPVTWPRVLAVIGVCAAMVGGQFATVSSLKLFFYARTGSAMASGTAAGQPVDIPVDDQEVIDGPVDAKNTLVIFSDFECPYCRRYAQFLNRKLLPRKLPLRVVFKHFPLEMHRHARRAAQAAEAARLQGGAKVFRIVHDILFSPGTNLDRFNYARLAKQLNLDVDRFLKDLDSPQVADRIKQDIQLGKKLGVRGTPTVFLNGLRLTDHDNLSAYVKAVSGKGKVAQVAKAAARPARPTAPVGPPRRRSKQCLGSKLTRTQQIRDLKWGHDSHAPRAAQTGSARRPAPPVIPSKPPTPRDDDTIGLDLLFGTHIVDIPVDRNDAARGPADAPNTVVVFTSYGNAGDRRFADFIESDLLPKIGSLRVVFKQFPLDRTCNSVARDETTSGACKAARAAEAARRQGNTDKFWKMHRQLVNHAGDLETADYTKLAQAAGLDVDRFLKDLDSDQVKRHVDRDVSLGNRLEVISTPTVFLNGRRILDTTSLDRYLSLLRTGSRGPTTRTGHAVRPPQRQQPPPLRPAPKTKSPTALPPA